MRQLLPINSNSHHTGAVPSLTGSAAAWLGGETSIAEAQSLLDTNVLGILRTTQAVLPHMRKQGSGRIVNVSSVVGFLPAPYMGLYSASKHAVQGMSETLDHEARQFGIRVTLVEPSFTRTPDLNAPHAMSRTGQNHGVARTIIETALGRWRMRHTPAGQLRF